MHVAAAVALLVRAFAAVALGVGHGHAEREVAVLYAMQIRQEFRPVFGRAAAVVDARRDLVNGIERILRQVAHGAAGFLADPAHGLKLVQQVTGACIDVQETIHGLAAAVLHCGHQGGEFRTQGKIVSHSHRVQTGLERSFVGHRFHQAPVQIDHRMVLTQGVAVFPGGHQRDHGGTSGADVATDR
jgi:hypothetical protein